MAQTLLLPDDASVADVLTFAGRTAQLGDGAVRLQAAMGVLRVSSAPLAPRGLLDVTPTVLGMRALRVDQELVCDLLVPAASLARDDDPRALRLPEYAVSAAWAGVSPPQSGWHRDGALTADALVAVSRHGMAAVAHAMPTDPGEDAVRAIRARVWGEPDERLGELPAGAAFVGVALGIVDGPEAAQLWHAPGWTRLRLDRGNVLVRRPARSGLGPLRTTG